MGRNMALIRCAFASLHLGGRLTKKCSQLVADLFAFLHLGLHLSVNIAIVCEEAAKILELWCLIEWLATDVDVGSA